MLKAKKLRTKNPKMKHSVCLKYVIKHRLDLHNLQTTKILKTQLRIKTDPS